MTKLYTSPAAKAIWEANRTTPRGRGLVKSVVVIQNRISLKKAALHKGKPRMRPLTPKEQARLARRIAEGVYANASATA